MRQKFVFDINILHDEFLLNIMNKILFEIPRTFNNILLSRRICLFPVIEKGK